MYSYVFDHDKWHYIYYWDHEHKKHFGQSNQDVVFFCIRKNPKATGLLSCYLHALGLLQSLEGLGMVPVMDMQSFYYSMIHESDETDVRSNAWEYYFERFSHYSMHEVYNSKNVIFSVGRTQPEWRVFFDDTVLDRDLIQQWVPLDQKYFKLKPELKARFCETSRRLLGSKRVLGVMIREAYIVLAEGRDSDSELYKTHPGIQNHPVQPSVMELIDRLHILLKKWQCEYLYVVCETSFVIEMLKTEFQNRLLYTDRRRKSVNELTLRAYRDAGTTFWNGYSVVESNTDYLEEIYLLSQCTSMISGKCSGSIVASLWNRGQYEQLDFFNKGLY